MEKFATYLAAVDGSNDWSVVGPLFDDAFDADCIFVTADGELDKQQWSEVTKNLVAKGGVASGFEVTAREGDTAYYQVTVSVPGDEPLEMKARGTLRDGRLMRVEPLDPGVYSQMVERSR